jgi:uncharacterized protein (TIGR03437 family)
MKSKYNLIKPALLLVATCLQAQVLDNSFLSGRYGFRQVLLSTNPQGQPIEARSLVGVLSFDGRGTFSYEGTRNLGTGGPGAFRGTGNYTVEPSGFVNMSNPLENNARLNMRLGTGLLIGATTDSAGNVFDILIAIPLPTAPAGNSVINGPYAGVSLEFPNGIFFNVKNSFFRFSANGQGGLGILNTSGQSSQSGQRVQQQAIGPATYGLNADSSGLIIIPSTAPFTPQQQLLLGDKQVFVSAGGDYLVGGSISQGAHDILFAMRTLPGSGSVTSLRGFYFGAGLKAEQSRPSNFSGTLNALGNGRAVWSRRARLPEGNVDATAVNDYNVGVDGVGSMLNNRLAVGVNGNIFLQSGTSFVDTDNYELAIGVRARELSGTGTFINPLGVFNGASFAPAGNPIAPGQFIALFGTGLGPPAPVVAAPPFPPTLSNVTVTIQGRPAPLYFVAANQISALVPFGTSGQSADIIVRNGAQESNTVTVPVARTSPGIYSLTQNGIGPGAILKPDFSLVSATNPTRRGDTILVYLTGLGALSPAVADGTAPGSNPLSRVVDSVNVYIGGIRAAVSYAGGAPGLAGLYQINCVIPANAPIGNAVPLAIETTSAFHDMVDVAIASTPAP